MSTICKGMPISLEKNLVTANSGIHAGLHRIPFPGRHDIHKPGMENVRVLTGSGSRRSPLRGCASWHIVGAMTRCCPSLPLLGVNARAPKCQSRGTVAFLLDPTRGLGQ